MKSLNPWILIVVGVFLMLPKVGLWIWMQRLTGKDRVGTAVWEIGLVCIFFGVLLLLM